MYRSHLKNAILSLEKGDRNGFDLRTVEVIDPLIIRPTPRADGKGQPRQGERAVLRGTFFDHLNNMEIIPNHQSRSSNLAGIERISEYLHDRFWIGVETINSPQHRATSRGFLADLFDQTAYQGLITMERNHTTKPETRESTHGTRNPDRADLCLSRELIGLYLTKFKTCLSNLLVMDLLGVLACFALPISYGSFIKTKGEHNRLDRTAMREQGHHQHDHPARLFEAIQHRATGFGKGFSTGMTGVLTFRT